ncbi:PspC domain-containing protein [Candidatus Woesearchaeota archaeon]|nr:PspC domain-containing protein [Candidatus Woesearchaeota archaeon]
MTSKRLYRSEDRFLGGVCGGIARYIEVDPSIIRVLWVLVTAFTGFVAGIIAYLVCWMIIPEQG